ncbi:SDR family oxidoreductase [Cellulomonas sp. HZM]|uniref:SDR family NAD(P)-dependent oxidoreductase n=1 Tax=Cellulomonas sp. HZM TaxID=1454010 RepID=UPI00049301A9|nr:SDR family oxidoreductase [Cellulomonas sp. HZM]
MTPRDVPRTALVTGAGRGIGRGIALGLAEAGFGVALVGRTRRHLEEVADVVRGSGGRVVVVPADLVDAAAVADAVSRAQDELGGLGLVVNNAGVIEHAETDLVAEDVEDVWRVIETNVRGPLLVSRAVLPGMLAHGGGRIVQINSGAGYSASATYTGYGISKGALARLTTALDAQYGARGLVAIDVAPGVVATDMTGAMPMHAARETWTAVEDVAAMVVAIGEGRLDALAGRFVRVGSDTVESLTVAAEVIRSRDARRLRVVGYGDDDPMIR